MLEASGFKPDFHGRQSSWLGHTHFAHFIMNAVKPSIFVEVGTQRGHSYFSFCQIVKECELPTKCFAIDPLKKDDEGGFCREDFYGDAARLNEQAYSDFSELISADNTEAHSHFSDGSIALMHIDGLPAYGQVKKTFLHWLPKLAPGAVVLLHDTMVTKHGVGVGKFWKELSQRYPMHLEFTHSLGLGVFQLEGAPGDDRYPWLEPESVQQKEVKDYFEALGKRARERMDLIPVETPLEELEIENYETRQRIKTLTETLSERDSSLRELVAENEALRKGNEKILNSLSWKSTKPVRVMMDIMLLGTRPTFDAEWYLENNPDVQSAGLKPYQHYKTHGKAEGREPCEGYKERRSLSKLKQLTTSVLLEQGGIYNCLLQVLRVLQRDGIMGFRRGLVNKGFLKIDPTDYQSWILLYDTINTSKRRRILHRIHNLPKKPKISILMPVYDPPVQYLDKAIQSVRGQLYPEWELCIADDASENQQVRDLLSKHAKEDNRIKVVFREENGHISNASNSALALASGEFIALLDHDDLLPEHALYHLAKTIINHPDVGLIYSDEDKVDAQGVRHSPYFKCDFNPELMLAQNMISHLGAFRRTLVESVKGFRTGFEGSQDYDLAFRILERIEPAQVEHIPHVLYHWRAFQGSTALSTNEKKYAVDRSRRAVLEHLHRTGVDAEALPAPFVPSYHRVKFNVPERKPMVSIIIPMRDKVNLLRTCIRSILSKTNYPAYEIIVMDNGSEEPETITYLKNLPAAKITVMQDSSPFNYSALNNTAEKKSNGSLLCLLNNDIEVLHPEWLEEMVSFAIQPEIGAVGARLWYDNDRLQHAGCILGIDGVAGHAHKYVHRGDPGYFGRAVLHQELSAVTGACLLVRREVYREVRGLNESLAVCFNDIDFCLRIQQAGYRNIWTPYAQLRHHESPSRGPEDTPEKQARFLKEFDYMKNTWGNYLVNDPAYNPNLTLKTEDFGLAWPPRARE